MIIVVVTLPSVAVVRVDVGIPPSDVSCRSGATLIIVFPCHAGAFPTAARENEPLRRQRTDFLVGSRANLRLGRVDGFNQDEVECHSYEGSVVLRSSRIGVR